MGKVVDLIKLDIIRTSSSPWIWDHMPVVILAIVILGLSPLGVPAMFPKLACSKQVMVMLALLAIDLAFLFSLYYFLKDHDTIRHESVQFEIDIAATVSLTGSI